MSPEADLLVAFEEHSPDGIRAALAAGAGPNIESLVESYLRSPRFADCLRVLIEAGASTSDPLLEAVLLDDEVTLQQVLDSSPQEVGRLLRVRSAFTSCEGVTALHVCAEFNCVRCARVLLAQGADVNTCAETDGDGLGGQTPIFHCVNSIFNYCRPMMELLVDAGASLDVRLKGVVWGPGADWETLVLDVTPVSYAQCGLYAQFHRRERDVYDNLAYLYQKRHGAELSLRNVPNRYLAPRK